MSNLDTTVNVIGIGYGLLLILTAFVRSRLTEPMRVDTLFSPKTSESTRPLNLVVGLLVVGYGLYSLLLR